MLTTTQIIELLIETTTTFNKITSRQKFYLLNKQSSDTTFNKLIHIQKKRFIHAIDAIFFEQCIYC